MMGTKDSISGSIGGCLRTVIKNIDECFFSSLQEIRIRLGRPLIFFTPAGELFFNGYGQRVDNIKEAYIITKPDIEKTLELLSGCSLYAFEEEMRNGFVTIEGGHRIGISGKTVLENGLVKTMTNISGFNIRVARENKTAADAVIKNIILKGELLNTLIISPPGCGKTTMLRDIIRRLSDDFEKNVGVPDERSEIAASYRGVPQMDTGIRSDILDCCPKDTGIIMLLRSMSPDVIAADEIGRKNDIDAIEEIINSGIRFIFTVHGHSIEDIWKKPYISKLLNKKAFERYVLLSGKGKNDRKTEIFDGEFKKIKQ